MPLTLCLSSISKQYNGKYALKDCSFPFDGGGVFAIMGPNGSGKSTLLRICALIEPPDKGEVIYVSGGRILRHDLSLKRKIALVPPDAGVFDATVFMNVAYGLKMRRVGRIAIDDRVQMALVTAGLADKRMAHANTLSRGEVQRLVIARAIAVDPVILFLDEPTATLDEENTRRVEDIIMSIQSEGQMTVIFTTHDREQAERMTDNIIPLHDGHMRD